MMQWGALRPDMMTAVTAAAVPSPHGRSRALPFSSQWQRPLHPGSDRPCISTVGAAPPPYPVRQGRPEQPLHPDSRRVDCTISSPPRAVMLGEVGGNIKHGVVGRLDFWRTATSSTDEVTRVHLVEDGHLCSIGTVRVNDVHPPGGYVNFLQNPASFPFPQQMPSHSDIPHNNNFVGGFSHHTPLPATQPSATKKTQKGASNKRTRSSINLEDGDEGQPSNKKRMPWTTKEDEKLMGAWLSNSNDAISGNYKKNDQYWDAVTAEYNSNTSDNNRKRQTKQCMSRWHRVNKIVNDFHAVYTEISQVYSSGQSDSDLMDKVQIKYEKENGPFLHKDTWEACKKFPKWLAYNAEMHGSKKRDVADLGDVGVKSSPIPDIPRPPMGVKKAKAERDGKGKNTQVSKDMEELNKYIEAQEKATKNRTEVLEVQKRISQDKVEASRLALEAAKENKEAKTKAKMLEQYTKLLTHDTSRMTDDMKAEQLKAISLMRETLWGRPHQN